MRNIIKDRSHITQAKFWSFLTPCPSPNMLYMPEMNNMVHEYHLIAWCYSILEQIGLIRKKLHF